jgi:hypothetical protein
MPDFVLLSAPPQDTASDMTAVTDTMDSTNSTDVTAATDIDMTDTTV